MSGPACFAGASLVFALVTVFGYFGAALGAGLAATLLLGLLALTAAGVGRVLVGLLGFTDELDAPKTLLGATLGLGVFSLLTFALAAAGALNAGALTVSIGLLWLISYTQLRAVFASFGPSLSLLRERPVPALAVAGALLAVLWTCWVPPHHYDSLVYHLPLPVAYLRQGSLTPVPHLVYSHFPQNAEMLFTLALALKSDLLAQMFSWLALALTVCWVFEMGKREAPLPAVLLGCVLLSTHTAVMLLAGTTYSEPFVMLWLTAAVISFYRWRAAAAGQSGRRGWLALSGVFLGLALGAKYYAGIAAGILGAQLVLRLAVGGPLDRRARWADLLLLVGITTVLFSPWLIKNALCVGNPVFPFLYSWFPNTGTGWNGAAARAYFEILTEYKVGGGFLDALSRLPFQLLGNSLRFGGGMDALGSLGWDLSFWCLPLGLWAARGNKFLRSLGIFCLVYTAVWFSTGVVLRFLTVIAPLLCLLAGCGLHALWLRLSSAGRGALGTAVVLLTGCHLALFLYVHGVFGSGSVLLGFEESPQFLAKRLDYYACARWARESLGKNDRLLLVGEQRGYYVEQAHVATTVNAPNAFLSWSEDAAGPEAYAARLKAEGLTHLILVPRELSRIRPAMKPWSDRGYQNLMGLEPRFIAPLFKGPACAVYALK